MDDKKPKTEGWRKLGIGISGIAALSYNPTMDFKIAVIIGLIAIVGIAVQGWLDNGKRPPKTD